MDGNENTSRPGCPFGSETEGRLTMRDAILARAGTRVQTSDPQGAHFDTLLQVTPGGFPLNVTRGWTSVNAQGQARLSRSSGSSTPTSRLSTTRPTNHTNQNTDVGNGQVRQAQANELIANGGPATGKLPVVLVGDLNSDTQTPLKPGDQLADRDLLNAGFAERSTYDPLGLLPERGRPQPGKRRAGLAVRPQGRPRDDRRPGHIKLVDSTVTGRHPLQRVLGLRPRGHLQRPGLQVGAAARCPPRPRSTGAGRSHALWAPPARPWTAGKHLLASDSDFFRERFRRRT